MALAAPRSEAIMSRNSPTSDRSRPLTGAARSPGELLRIDRHAHLALLRLNHNGQRQHRGEAYPAKNGEDAKKSKQCWQSAAPMPRVALKNTP